ncbi:putative ABC transport system permease protein [Luteibacter sp. UNC138MFCol5.1]|uniref:ABC transporter permease n=1 Tax=Luteibacter sp. UNC138MFCol5.1 TaxID=1502774 RepID=UPI0008B78A1D|nr:ABC transporter permease [Luteibacter sp. UNC138MFCol5.1]SEO46028.1 putative ABC transport system permease protein [Luteibacter sp. UNC138MFCol5.1]
MKSLKKFGAGLLTLLIVAVFLAIWIALPWPGIVALAVVLALWMALTRRGRQTWEVTKVGLATVTQRLGSSSVVVVGIAGVVGVLVAMLAMSEGFAETLRSTGNDQTAIVLRGGSQAELNSILDRDSANVVIQAPGVKKDAQGKPIASGELVVVANLPKKGDPQSDANVPIRGVSEDVWNLRQQVKIVEGRKFQPGLRELIVGKGARAQFEGLDVGKSIRLAGQTWTVVGVFDSGDALESELWGDTQSVASAYRRGSSVQSVTVLLDSPKAFDTFKAALAGDPRLKVDVSTTREYFGKQSEGLTKVLRAVGITVGIIMAIGAVFGALNTMFAAIQARAREIATLRAIGFRGLPVVVSIMLETMLLALLGGLIGAGIVWIIFNGYTASTLGANFSQVVFRFHVSGDLLWTGIKWALAIGFIGGLFPALRAARLPVTAALREL